MSRNQTVELTRITNQRGQKRSYPALIDLLAQAERRYKNAPDDDMWIKHYLIWMALHALKMGLGEAI